MCREKQGTDEGMCDEEHIGCGCSYVLLMWKCNYNLVIGRHTLVRSPKPGFLTY